MATITLDDLAQPQQLHAAVHVVAHLPPERPHVLGLAVRLERPVVDVALHEHVGPGRLRAMQHVERAPWLVRSDLFDHLPGHDLELLLHPGLDLQRRDDSEHFETSSRSVHRCARTIAQREWTARASAGIYERVTSK